MNKKIIFSITGKLLEVFSLLLLLPAVVSVIYKEHEAYTFLICAAISFVIGVILRHFTKKSDTTLYAKEGFVVVSLAWVTTSLIGCLPFVISGEIPSFVDALFETVSGFTTTGATILSDVEALSRGMLFWRSFTHWIGGMGVLVFVIAFVNSISDRSIHILRAEMPGPTVGKLVPRAKDTSKMLYIMYIILTLAEIIFLWCGDMDLYDSVVHSFGTAGTGGFGVKASSIGGYSAYSQWVITAFMLLFGVNFNLYYLMIMKRFRMAFKSEELWVYIGMVVAFSAAIAINISSMFESVSDAVRHSVFQVASLITTTGYATMDFMAWPEFSRALVFILLFTGACAGSTCGGLKLSRIMLLFKRIAKEIKQMVRPRSVANIKFEGKDVDEHTQNGVTTYFAFYMLCIFAIYVAISFEPFGFETNFTAVVTCFNNVGPGFGMISPSGSFADYSDVAKLIFSFAMLLGRLEIFPIIIALIPSTWRKR